jgi:hypothetical protein
LFLVPRTKRPADVIPVEELAREADDQWFGRPSEVHVHSLGEGGLARWEARVAALRHRLEPFTAVVWRGRDWYWISIGADRAFSPRHQPPAERTVRLPASHVVALLGWHSQIDVPGARLRVDPHVAADGSMVAGLQLTGVWRPVAIRIRVIKHVQTWSRLSVSLHTPYRWRYPARYYHALHAVLDRLVARLEDEPVT